jgi:hypothetical protein
MPLEKKKAELRLASVNVPLIMRLRELDQVKRQAQFLEELAKSSAWRLELDCREPVVGIKRLQRALEAKQVVFLFDEDARARIDLSLPGAAFAVYLENVPASEVVQTFRDIGSERNGVNGKNKNSTAGFEKVRLRSMTASDRDQFSKLLQLDSRAIESRMKDDSVPRSPVQGSLQSEAGSAKKSERTAVVVRSDYESGARPLTQPVSPGIRQFFETRQERRPGGSHALIYIHPVDEK